MLKNPNARILGLDIGDKRVGVAINDPLGWNKAQPLKVIERIHFLNELPKIIDEYTIEQIVAGIPKGEKGELTPQAKKTLKFIEEIKKKVSVPIVLWDETLTTYEAESILIEADVSRKKRKEISDKLAAALILQSYLNHESNAS